MCSMCQALQSIEQCIVIWQILSYTEASWQSAEGIYVELHSAHLRSVTGCTLQWPMGTYDTVPRALGGLVCCWRFCKQWSNSGHWVSSPIVAIKYCQVGQYCNASILSFAFVVFWRCGINHCISGGAWPWVGYWGGALEHPSSFTSYSYFHLCLL